MTAFIPSFSSSTRQFRQPSTFVQRRVCAQVRPRSRAVVRASAAEPASVSPADVAPPEGHDCRLLIDGHWVAYDYFPGSGPTIVFLPGFFYSRWRQAKANALEIFAKRKGQAVLVEEYLGIGRSEGDFIRDGTLSRWIADTVRLIEEVVGDGKVIIVGAGIGGWIMLHVAMRLKGQVVGLVGMNPSVDFTEDLLWPSLTEEQKEMIEEKGMVDLPWGFRSYPIGKNLVEDAKKWLVMRGASGSLDIECPVRLLQGLNDEELPPERILRLVDKLKSDDVVAQYVKFADHVMDSDEDLQRMWETVCQVSDKYFEYDLTSPSSG